MTRTFLDLRNDVTALVIDLPPTVAAAVPRLVNNAIRSIQRKYNFRVMETFIQFTTTPSQPLIATISNFKEFMDRGPYLFHQFRKGEFLVNSTIPDHDSALSTLTITTPAKPRFISSLINSSTGVATFYLVPYPDQNSDWSDGNYQVKFQYYSYSPDLVADEDTNWFTTNADDYIIYKAVGEGFGLDWDYDAMALWLQRAEEKFKEVKLADKYSRLAGVDTFVPFWEGANSPKVRV